MKENRLLINMKNKIEVINRSIDQVYRLKRGETLRFGEHVDGAAKFTVSVEQEKRNELNDVLIKLFDEREKLQERVNRFRQ